MRRLIVAVALVLPVAAHAQAPQQTALDQALGQEVISCVADKVQARAAVIAAQQHEATAVAEAVAKQKAEDTKAPPAPK